MLKILLLVAVVVVAILLFKSRHRVPGPPPAHKPPAPPAPPAGPQAMLACAHCGVHLPQSDALMDASGRPFCTEAHRLAGPR